MTAYQWTTPIRYVRGLGPVKARELAKIGINIVGDLLEKHPLHYLYPGGVSIAEAKEGYVVIKAEITKLQRYVTRISVVEATLNDGTETCRALWFNQQYALQHLRPGMTVTFWGKYKGGVLTQPRWTTIESSMTDVWGGQYGTHHQTIRAALVEVLGNVASIPTVKLPLMFDGWPREFIFKMFHFPDNKKQQQQALHDLKFDECLLMQLALAERRKKWDQAIWVTHPMRYSPRINTKIMSYFPYEFTNEQQVVTRDIRSAFRTGRIMQRLIHGEVGSGKTAVAFYAAMLAALNGKRTLILCPTTILAAQHYETLKSMGWDNVGLKTGNFVDDRQYQGGGKVIIGTHAILNDERLLKSASLVIIDEFQKFGVEQRAKIQCHNPHLLLLSATPIPRTLAVTVFGDLDVSVIRELPIKRGTVITRWVLPEKREAIYEIIEKELAKGKQAYVVYPRIKGDEDVVSAEKGFEDLVERYFGKYCVHLLIGKHSTKHKSKVLRGFRLNQVQILVSTIIAEVGLDNPNATVMVVDGADRFGLSQLHQLRGRVCRSTDTAFCFLVSETANEKSIARLEVIERCNDGFEIAEADLQLRGPGELFSTRQHGLPDLKFASLVDDYDLMIEARELAKTIPADTGIREMMRIKYGDNLQLGETV